MRIVVTHTVKDARNIIYEIQVRYFIYVNADFITIN